MKRTTSVIAAMAVVAGIISASPAAYAQAKSPSSVGLIDMAEVFENYQKFKDLREGLKDELKSREGEIKSIAEAIQKAQKDLQESPFEKNSPQYVDQEKRLITLNAELKTKQATIQREFLRRESQMYKDVYMEVSKMVGAAANHYGYTVVLRFRRGDVGTEDEAQKILQGMNRLVIYHQTQDDITDRVIQVLNKSYNSTAKKP
ncbi:OmpH family outer membrane protein [Calycomorphotria hydatis]|uniref:Periplasmic chaperone n=1 Tax=Calycomorphotria hydatis TaxID=2528027 RepID=A0A517T3Z7_9PLAN|nr:OmpH family outer membrane protein [Calycomorphotria hydatis]QDT63095.1 periplasmic chaperone [Calycomorphotria hydatis]